jgi:hypothetical protein
VTQDLRKTQKLPKKSLMVKDHYQLFIALSSMYRMSACPALFNKCSHLTWRFWGARQGFFLSLLAENVPGWAEQGKLASPAGDVAKSSHTASAAAPPAGPNKLAHR